MNFSPQINRDAVASTFSAQTQFRSQNQVHSFTFKRFDHAHTESLSTKVSYEDVSLDTRLMPGNVLKPRRDCACCACGPSSFVAVGGFDGEQETMDMLVFEVSV